MSLRDRGTFSGEAHPDPSGVVARPEGYRLEQPGMVPGCARRAWAKPRDRFRVACLAGRRPRCALGAGPDSGG
jgi:hypothetical protein